jgi:hypothetical protein
MRQRIPANGQDIIYTFDRQVTEYLSFVDSCEILRLSVVLETINPSRHLLPRLCADDY